MEKRNSSTGHGNLVTAPLSSRTHVLICEVDTLSSLQPSKHRVCSRGFPSAPNGGSILRVLLKGWLAPAAAVFRARLFLNAWAGTEETNDSKRRRVVVRSLIEATLEYS